MEESIHRYSFKDGKETIEDLSEMGRISIKRGAVETNKGWERGVECGSLGTLFLPLTPPPQ